MWRQAWELPMTICRYAALAAGLVLMLAVSVPANAQPYPNRPVKIIVSHAAGSSPDVVARLTANHLTQRLGQTFVIENKVGANGSLAVEAASRSPADGYTLLIAGSSILTTNPFLYPKTSAAILTGLAPVTKLTNLDFLLAVRSSLNIRTFKELVAHIRANPGKLNMATTNVGSFQQLGAELLRQQGDLDFKTIPYNGGAAAAAAVAGGHVDMLIDASAIIAPLAQSGALTIVATTGAARDPDLPDVPTVAESGFPGYRVDGWIGMAAPAGTSPDILLKLQSNIAAAFGEDATKAQLKPMGLIPVANTPAAFAADLDRERETWKRLIAKLGLSLE
jgi:tripartite-type tricarboxylate transporter receptor subunit TctC